MLGGLLITLLLSGGQYGAGKGLVKGALLMEQLLLCMGRVLIERLLLSGACSCTAYPMSETVLIGSEYIILVGLYSGALMTFCKKFM